MYLHTLGKYHQVDRIVVSYGLPFCPLTFLMLARSLWGLVTIMSRTPGSMTMYSTAVRGGLPAPNDTPPSVSPASYESTKTITCRPCVTENNAPFLTSSIRKPLIPNGVPSPNQYYPVIKPRWDVGCPLMRLDHRVAKSRYTSIGAGPCYKVSDPWIKLLQECQCMASKRWRVKYDKYVSNNVPTVYHPLEIRSFYCGLDGRMYPLKNKSYKAKTPGPIYNCRDIRTCKSRAPRNINFWYSTGRLPLFPKKSGACPADFTIPRGLCRIGGVFLSKTDDPKESNFRLFEYLVCKASKTIYPSPMNYYVKGGLDVMSSKAVSAPFKSQVPRLVPDNRFQGPGPADYFEAVMTLNDLDPPIYPRNPSYFTFPPEGAPFNCTEDRFNDSKLVEEAYFRPSPADYDIPSFTDLLYCACKRNTPAICNPKLGFLTSAEARPRHMFKFSDQGGDADWADAPRPWRNIRPRRIRTYPYHGPPPRFPDSPGPIYDTDRAVRAIKGRCDWWDPRHTVDIGFNTSGCTRNIQLSDIDRNIPGPGLYYAVKPEKRSSGGTIKTTGPRVSAINISSGPGPKYKLHDKVGSSMWRGSHLGTYNIYLKGVDIQYPNSGGYRPRGPLDRLGDKAACIDRHDDYQEQLCPTSIDAQCQFHNKRRSQTVSYV